MLTLMLFVIGVNGMKAQELSTLTADLSAITTVGNASYDKEAQKITYTATSYSMAWVEDITGIPVYQAKTLTINCSEATTGYRLDIYLTDGTEIIGTEAAGTRLSGDNAATAALSQTFDLTTILAAHQKKTIQKIRLNTALAAADAEGGSYIVLSNISLAYDATAEQEEEELGEGYVDMEASMFKAYASIEKGAEVTNENPGCEFNIGAEVAAGGTIYGNGSVAALTYADLTGYDQLILTISSGTPRLLFNRTTDTSTDYKEINSTNDELVTVDENGKWIIDLTGIKTATNKEYVHLNVIKATWGGAAKIKRAVLHEAPVPTITAVSGHEFDLAGFKFGKWDGFDGSATMTEEVTPDIKIGESGNGGTEIYGKSGNVANDHYADLTGYKKMILEGTAGKTLRVMINRQADNSLVEINPTFAEDGTAEIDLSGYEYVHLNSIKVSWGNDGTTVSKVALYKENVPVDYYLSGEGELDATATAALADANATIYDATGVTGSYLTLQHANPNAIFIANEGVLNMDNVCVNGYIDFLRLSDASPFAFPASATVGTGAYFREQNNEFGTICLPFAITYSSPKLYTIQGFSNGALILQEVKELAAGAPAIVWDENKSFELTGTGDLSEAKATNGIVQLNGSYTKQVIDVTAESGTAFFGISNNTFVMATKTLTVNPFRAYLTTTAAGAKERLTLETPEATAISALTAEDATMEAVFNAAGARQNGLQKGLNIVKMSNGETMKVVVK